MTDIFFSYSSVDRDRIRPVRDALVAQGFEVFWDQQVPAGVDWDTWIRQHLASCKCAIVFWSSASIASRNVRHEATIADQQGKLIPVLLEPLTAQQFPMGLYTHQAASLVNWNGDASHEDWSKLRREYEAKLMPGWVRQQMDQLEAELVGLRARCEKVERRDRTLQAQIAKQAEANHDLTLERDKALEEVAALKTTNEKLAQAQLAAEAREAKRQQELTRERDCARDDAAALGATIKELSRARSENEAKVVELSRSLGETTAQLSALTKSSTRQIELAKGAMRAALFAKGSTMQFVSLAAAVATVGFWTYHLIWSGSQPFPPVASEQAPNIKGVDFVQHPRPPNANEATFVQQAPSIQQAAPANTKEVATQKSVPLVTSEPAKEATSDQKSGPPNTSGPSSAQQAASQLAPQQASPQATDTPAASTPTLAPLAQQRDNTKSAALPQSTSTVLAPSFELRPNVAGVDKMPTRSNGNSTVEACQEGCAQMGACQAFTFSKNSKLCFLYDQLPAFRSNPDFDSGVRLSPQPAAQQTTGMFTIKANTAVFGYDFNQRVVSSFAGCEQVCSQTWDCAVFTYHKVWKRCYMYRSNQYSSSSLRTDANFDAGIRK